LLLAILTLVTKQVQKLRSTVLAYGKLKLYADQPSTYWTQVISQLTVPKYYFSHFYVIGLLFALECLVELGVCFHTTHVGPVLFLVRHVDTPEGSRRISLVQSLICSSLMTLHLLKRVYESFFVERPSKTAVMHVTHYLVGIGFYGAVVFGTWLEGAAYFGVWSSGKYIYTTCICT
jgi:3-oxo-5-alpha-steroid 4-dehydrogenase 3